MLRRLQDEYAGQAVRFLIFPCNQFGSQEPASNAEVKAFAEKFVKLGPKSNVVMLAKSNLNNVPCDASGADVCTPASKQCCPANDPVYEYLLSVTPPGKIKWNFDKIIVDASGKPFSGETVFHGADVDSAVRASIARASVELAVRERVAWARPLCAAAALLAATMALAFAVRTVRPKRETEQKAYIRLV